MNDHTMQADLLTTLRSEIESVRRDGKETAARVERLEGRVTGVEAKADMSLQVVEWLRGDWIRRMDETDAKRDAQFAQVVTLVEGVQRDVRRWRGYEQVARAGIGLLSTVPVVRWVRSALAWLMTLAGGVGLALVILHFVILWR